VILFNAVVQILHGTEFTRYDERALRLEHRNGRWIGRIFVHIDDPRHDGVGIAKGFAEEVLGCSSMAMGLSTNSSV
jgi:hypothetical protein